MKNQALFRPLIQPSFLLLLGAYLLVRLGRMDLFELPILVNSYLSDLVCMPLILTLCCIGVRLLKNLPHFQLNFLMIFGMTSFYALYFEYYLPLQNSSYTADNIDILMYFIGAFGYWYLQKSNRIAATSLSSSSRNSS